MKKLIALLLIGIFCFSMAGCNNDRAFSLVGKWEMSEYSDSANGTEFDSTLSDDEKAYMIFEEDSTFYTMELGLLDASGEWKLIEDKFLVFDFSGNELTLDITVESTDIVLVENAGEYQRWRRVD